MTRLPRALWYVLIALSGLVMPSSSLFADAPILTIRDPDVNNDGPVTAGDIGAVIAAFGSFPGRSNWNPAADLNIDGAVSAGDINLVLAAFGQANWPTPSEPTRNSPATPIKVATDKPFQLYVTAADPDNDPLTFSPPPSLPPGATFTNPGATSADRQENRKIGEENRGKSGTGTINQLAGLQRSRRSFYGTAGPPGRSRVAPPHHPAWQSPPSRLLRGGGSPVLPVVSGRGSL